MKIRHSYVFAGLCFAVALPHRFGIATTLDNLAECRAASTDYFSFRECVGMQHQASETLLTSIENSWREYLTAGLSVGEPENSDGSIELSAGMNTAIDIPPSSAVNVSSEQESNVGSSNSEQATNSGNVIAIVGNDPVPGFGSRREVVNISNQILLESEFPALIRGDEIDHSLQAQSERFETLSDLFRQYRSKRCAWESGLFGSDRLDVYITACSAWLNQERAKQMRLQLSEKRASDANGMFFNGFYIEDGEGGIFQSCDRRQEWRIAGEPHVLAEITTRYDAIARDNLEMAYLEVRGDLALTKLGAGFSGSVRVRSLNLLRSIDQSDCSARPAENELKPTVSDNLAGQEDDVDSQGLAVQRAPDNETEDVTVDALGAAGFLYGYFANWVSACAVEENSVCMSQADSGYSGQGEWRLVIDRSLQRQWRVQLIPTIADTTIDRDISIEIDGATNRLVPVANGGAAIKAEVGITLARGESARQLVRQMRSGQKLSIDWTSPSEIGNAPSFSLVGITRALEFFDQNR